MPNGEFICTEHSGFVAQIKNLEGENKTQWEKIDKMDDKINSIFTRINILLGGMVITCIMLVINIAIK